MPGEVGLEIPEPRRELGEGDAERLHAPESRPCCVGADGRVGLAGLGAESRVARRRYGAASGARRRAAPPAGGGPRGIGGRGGPRRSLGAAATGRLDLLARPVDLLGEVAGDLVARRQRRAAAASSVAAELGVAQPLAQPAAGVEAAARRRVDRGRDVALEDDPAAAALASGSGTGTADSRATVYGWSGRVVELARRRDLDDLAEVHDRDPVADVARRPARSWAMNR